MSRPTALVVLAFAVWLAWLWLRFPSSCALAQARPYFLQPDGGVVAWDGGGP